jgi:hypothetical protein
MHFCRKSTGKTVSKWAGEPVKESRQRSATGIQLSWGRPLKTGGPGGPGSCTTRPMLT